MRVVLLLFVLSSISCKVQKVVTNNFYFPPHQYINEKTLYYVNQLDTTEKARWKIRTSITNGDTILHTAIFNNNQLTEEISERIKGGEASILTYKLYNGNQVRRCTIIDSAVYNASQNPTNPIHWKVRFQDFNSLDTVTLEKIRQLQTTGDNEQTFADRMKMTFLGSGGAYEYTVQSIYERGTGLISYRITRPDGSTRHYNLVDVK